MDMRRRNGIHASSLVLTLVIMSMLMVIAAPQGAISEEQTCQNTTYSLFTDSSDARTVEFPDGGGSDATSKMELPIGATVVSAQAHLIGTPKIFSEDRPLDIILVNDVSGSMDDNCHCADGTPSSNGYCTPAQGEPYHPDLPCKIEDMKNASTVFSDDVLDVTNNTLGLVSYENGVDSFLPLSTNLTAVINEIDAYDAGGNTCISCGIRKARELSWAGQNDEQIIVLMSDGIANYCIPFVNCEPDSVARQEAIDEATAAWNNESISIITVGFGGDADEDLLMEIANISASNGGQGHYHFVNETDIEHLYEEIAGIITSTYPTNPNLDVGNNGVIEWNYVGPFNTEDDAVDYSTALEGLLSGCTCTGCQDMGGGICRVDFQLNSETAGFIEINTTVVIESCVECTQDADCDNGQYCDGQEYCDTGEECQGEPADCTTFDGDYEGCVGTDGCYIDSYFCDGVPDSCSLFDNDPTACDAIVGCSWGGFSCTGTPDPGLLSDSCFDLSFIYTYEECDAVPGCFTMSDFFCEGDGVSECQEGTYTCQPGTPPDCDDSVSCTDDSCNEGTDSCDHEPNDGLCDNGLYCDGVEYCDDLFGCMPDLPVDCSGSDLPEISQCNYNPDNNPSTWDFAAGFTSTCNETGKSCTTGSYSFTHECRDDDSGDGVNANQCGAECDQDSDCAPTDCDYLDGCRGNDWYDFDDVPNDCISDCSCEDNSCGEPVQIIINDPRCVNCTQDSDCDDGEFCNGEEVCNQHTFDCQDGTPPSCDDGVSCTIDSCNTGSDSCDNVINNSACDNGLFCDGTELCHVDNGCQPGPPVDCSPNDLPEISQCNYDPDSNPYTWDFADGFTSTCNEAADSCTTGSYSFTHECRDDDEFDGVDIQQCGAECDQHTDCSCPEDACFGDDWYDFPEDSFCNSCFCTPCEPEITQDHPDCVKVCERDGEFGDGHEYLCHGDGTYDRCREDGSGYDYENICMEECTAAPQCDGFPPMYHFQECDWTGETYLQDYCDIQCQIRDNFCESSFDGCTSDPECDEVIPGTDSCTYQCEYKPELCYVDGEWGDEPHQYVCLEDNTYNECIESGPGYGTHYEHVNECSYLCSGDLECDGLAPGTELSSCDIFGQDYLQDYCDMTCMLQDDNCESDFSGCTSDSGCDEFAPGSTEWEQCYTCQYQFCGDGIVNPFEPFNEECDPEMQNSDQCPQSTEECEDGTARLGIRDAYGECGECMCDPDAFEYDCVVGECGASCDEDSDCGNFCTGDTLSYSGACDLQVGCDCSYDTKDCNDYDYDYFVDFHCYVSTGDIYNWYQDWECSSEGTADCAYSGEDWPFFVQEDCFDSCEDTDGGIEFDIQGTVTDTELCDDEGQTECPEETYDDFCSAEGEVLTEYYCENFDVAWTTQDCDSLDHYDEYVYYCDGDDIRRNRQFHDFSCSPGGCTEDVSTVDDELVDECNAQDWWYNFGNDPGFDDPECEYRDYTCMEDGEPLCGYSVTESHDYDDQDGTYCADGDEAVEERDYYCNSNGDPLFTQGEPQDCGLEAWSGGGDIPGFGDDPACVYTDYFCVDSGVNDYCDSSQPYSDDYDYLDAVECDGDRLEGDHDFWCEVQLCDSFNPSNLCDSGDDFLNLRCSQFCGAQCDEDSDCADNSCEETYDDFCVGMKLSEYDSDMVQDSTTVEDDCDNTCDTSTESCSCSDCQVDCSPPQISSYCVEGQCGAECDDSGDCPPWLDVPNRECNYDIPCGTDCGCGPGSQEFCPPPGTVEQGVCYYGIRDCIDIEGCTLDTCVLEVGEFCDPMEGCMEVPCPDIDPITLFSDSTPEKAIEYPSGGGSDDSAKVSVPTDLVVYTATVNLTGAPVSFTEDRVLDFALVNDVSGSMDDNCYCADGTPSNGGFCTTSQGYPYSPDYPCKIDDMKNASKVFAQKVLAVSGNMLGTVAYSTKLKSFLPLSDDLTAIENRIDSYDAGGFTCISCGIRKGIEVISAGDNIPVMILMSDGLANHCFAGVNCEDSVARSQALSEAQRAWDDFGISIIAVGFGDDADQALMGSIANVSGNDGGLGQYFFAPEDEDLEFLYDDLATLLTQVAPTDPNLDTGEDGDTEWSYAGEFLTSETADFATELQSLLDCTCPGCSLAGDECIIDLELNSGTAGILIANNMEITGCIPEPPNGGVIACSSCTECGGGQDCQESLGGGGACGGMTCDLEISCTSYNSVVEYTCVNPGTTSSYCTSDEAIVYENYTMEVQTDGHDCDYGQFCVVDGICSNGDCVGSPRDCSDGNESTTDSCDDDQDTCVHTPIGDPDPPADADQDGVPDTEDACPAEWGDYCNGCPKPTCTGCAVAAECSDGVPTCVAGTCSDVACPADGCGLETCSSDEMTDYADFASAICQVEGLDGTCQADSCGFTCTLSELCGWEPECDPADHILISEVLYDPVNESGAEWVEIYNPTVSPVDISGWKLTDGEDTFIFPDQTTVNASDYLSVANSDEDFYSEFSCYPDLEALGLGLANGGDSMSLLTDQDALVDFVAWEGDSGWDLFAGEGNSILRDPAYCDTDTATDWLNDSAPSLTCSLFQEMEPCIEITNLRVLNDTLEEASVIEPGTMYHIEITNENICDGDRDVLTIAQVRENGDIAQGSVSYSILDSDEAVVTIGFLLPDDISPGTDIFVDIYNWNHWMFVNPGTWKALSLDGLIQFEAG